MGVNVTRVVKYIRKGSPGEKGEPGAVLRGPQAWSDCATGYAFQCGAEGEAWKDVVLYDNNYYSCVKSHAKTADNYPGSTADQSNGYWQLGDEIELVATKILLASYALVKNLGVECIDMRDADGNIIFQAKDGNVTCKTGTFDGITVRNALIESGKIAGFTIAGNGLSNSPFNNNADIVFRNDTQQTFAGIGGAMGAATPTFAHVARFENKNANPAGLIGLKRNTAVVMRAQNADYNHAFIGSGNGTLDGWMAGHKFSKLALPTNNAIMDGISLAENNVWVINAGESSLASSQGRVALPRLPLVQIALGIGSDDAFCLPLTIMADIGSGNFFICGRNKERYAGGSPFNDKQIPVIFQQGNTAYPDSKAMSAGKCVRFLLIYDPTQTATTAYPDSFPLQYTARLID